MQQRVPFFILAVLAATCAGIWSLALAPHVRTVADLEPTWLVHALAAADDPSAHQVAAVLAAQPKVLALSAPTKSSPCHVNGSLPDPACTPGAVFASSTVDEMCVAGYTQGVRSVSTSMKKRGYAAYGIAYPPPTGTYEFDHLIPLELGGNNDMANLFPEAVGTSSTPGFKEKDLVEDYLHNEVCAGHLSLPQAQAQIAENWVAVWSALSPATIAQLRQKYHSWAD